MYIITFLTSLGFLYVSEKHKNKYVRNFCVVIALLIPSILAGLRDYSVGNDVLLYGNGWFERATTYNSLIDYLRKADEYSIGVGYAFVNYVVSRFSGSAHFFYFCYELLQLIVLYFAIKPLKKEVSMTFAFAVYYFCYYNSSLNILRQIMAILIVLYSYRFILSRNLLKFSIAILIAFSFHSTGIVGFVLYPIYVAINNKQLKNVVKILIVIFSLALSVGYQYVFGLLASVNVLSPDRYLHYMTDSDVGGRFVRLSYWLIIMIIILWRGKKVTQYTDKTDFLKITMTMSFIVSIVMFVGSSWIIRVSYYFDIYQVLFLPIVAKNMGLKIGNKRNVAGYAIILITIIFYWFITFILRNGAATYPYKFMW